jgi:hypothetical protein
VLTSFGRKLIRKLIRKLGPRSSCRCGVASAYRAAPRRPIEPSVARTAEVKSSDRTPTLRSDRPAGEQWANTPSSASKTRMSRVATVAPGQPPSGAPRMQLQAQSEEAMIKVAVDDLDERFELIDRSRIATTVTAAATA